MSNTAITREQVEAAIPLLSQLAKETLSKTGVPGMAITIVYEDEVFLPEGFGKRKAGEDLSVDADTVFQLASASKPISSTIVAGLVGDRLLAWDDPIIKYDPGFQMDNPYVTRSVTIRDMFCHRSGLPDHAGDRMEDMGYDRATILNHLRYLPTSNRFRSAYNYTNFGLTQAAVAAAIAAGTSWEDLASKRLYQRLGMKQTSSRFADYAAAPNRAFTHVLVDNKWVAKYTRDPDAQSPAGGVSSSVRDMAQWMRLLLNGGKFAGEQVIVADALQETFRPQIVRPPGTAGPSGHVSFYGLGWNVDFDEQGRLELNHSGGFNLGAATAVRLLPTEQLGIVALTNSSPIGVPEAMCMSFFDYVEYGKLQRDWVALFQEIFAQEMAPDYGTTIDYSKRPANASPPLSLNAYAGTYANNFYGEIEIVEQDGGLYIAQGPTKKMFKLLAYNRDVFAYQPVGENAYGLSGVTFTVGGDWKATGVLVENLNVADPADEGQGTFTRLLGK
jgi:CubicO group peptidase (beta-lactamase class C family)